MIITNQDDSPGKDRILLVDDDHDTLELLEIGVKSFGFDCVKANDGLEAINMMRLEDIKLVLSDLRMPGADGMEVLRTSMRINPSIAVVIITAYGTLDTALEAMNEGAYDYVVKPFVMQQLLLVVRNAFKMAMLIEENDKMAVQLKETYKKLESIKKAGVQNAAAIAETEDEKENMSDEYQGNGESIKKYSSLVNGLKIK